MLQILSVTAPIFVLIGLGFVCVRTGLLTREHIRGMGNFVVYLALPALIVKSLSEHPISTALNWQYLTAYGLGSLAACLIGLLVALRLRRESLTSGALAAMGMSSSNSGYIGYPITLMAFGAPAAIGLALNLLVENLLILPLTLALADAGRQGGRLSGALVWNTLKRLARNPLVLAMVPGLLMSLMDWRLPAIPARAVDMLAASSAPVALLVIGGSLYGLRLNGLFAQIAPITAGKLLLHPLAVLGVFLLLPDVDPVLMAVGVVYAAGPMLSIYPIIGQRFGIEGRSAAALLLTTVMSFVSISAALALLAPH